MLVTGLVKYMLELFVGIVLVSRVCTSSPKQKFLEICPQLYPKTFEGFVPRGNLSAGLFEKMEQLITTSECIFGCCAKDNCNVVLLNDNICYHIACLNNELCIPTPSPNSDSAQKLSMILVKSTNGENWSNILQHQAQVDSPEGELNKEVYNVLSDRSHLNLEDAFRELISKQSLHYQEYCNLDSANICPVNEKCVPKHRTPRSGICECVDGYMRDEKGVCFPLILEDVALKPPMMNVLNRSMSEIPSTTNRTVPVTRHYLNIHAQSTNVTLPKDDVLLYATVEPEDSEENYQFEWISLHQPDKSTAVKDQNGGQLQLKKLTEGLYSFKN